MMKNNSNPVNHSLDHHRDAARDLLPKDLRKIFLMFSPFSFADLIPAVLKSER